MLRYPGRHLRGCCHLNCCGAPPTAGASAAITDRHACRRSPDRRPVEVRRIARGQTRVGLIANRVRARTLASIQILDDFLAEYDILPDHLRESQNYIRLGRDRLGSSSWRRHRSQPTWCNGTR